MTEQKQPVIYNNKRFKVVDYNFDMFVGPAAGEKFKDFPLTDLETGEAVKLSDFIGKWVVLETGSATCSMYTKDIPDMKALEAEFPDVEFLLIYVREAHPGERLGPHQSMDEKLKAARLLKPRYGEHRRILVDDLDGDFHRAYGSMPDVAYIMRPDGTIHYRCNWATPQGIRDALSDRENFHRVENADMKTIQASRAKFNMIRTMWTGGFVALFDFMKNAPAYRCKACQSRCLLQKTRSVQKSTTFTNCRTGTSRKATSRRITGLRPPSKGQIGSAPSRRKI